MSKTSDTPIPASKTQVTLSFTEDDKAVLDTITTRLGLSKTELLRRLLWVCAAGVPISKTLHLKDFIPEARRWLTESDV